MATALRSTVKAENFRYMDAYDMTTEAAGLCVAAREIQPNFQSAGGVVSFMQDTTALFRCGGERQHVPAHTRDAGTVTQRDMMHYRQSGVL